MPPWATVIIDGSVEVLSREDINAPDVMVALAPAFIVKESIMAPLFAIRFPPEKTFPLSIYPFDSRVTFPPEIDSSETIPPLMVIVAPSCTTSITEIPSESMIHVAPE